MDVGALAGGSFTMGLLGGALQAEQQQTAAEASVALLKKGLDLEKDQAALLLQTMGIGQNLNVLA